MRRSMGGLVVVDTVVDVVPRVIVAGRRGG